MGAAACILPWLFPLMSLPHGKSDCETQASPSRAASNGRPEGRAFISAIPITTSLNLPPLAPGPSTSVVGSSSRFPFARLRSRATSVKQQSQQDRKARPADQFQCEEQLTFRLAGRNERKHDP